MREVSVSDSRNPGSYTPSSFSRDEVEEILRRATEHANAATGDGILHEELLEAAREAGLDPASIDAAAAELAAQREDRRELTEARVEIEEERRRGFLQGLLTYFVVGLFLTGINLTVAKGPWAVWVLAIWGLFMALRGTRLFFAPNADRIEKRVEKKRRKRTAAQKRAERRDKATAWSQRLRDEMAASARRADDAARASRNFEEAVDSGVQALLGVLSRKVRDAAAAAEASERGRASSDFNRFVERQRRARGEPVPSPAQVRVEVTARAAKPSRVDVVEHEDVQDEELSIDRSTRRH